jgi:cytochrome c oxidase cbb3-type subunit I/II
VQWWYGHNAVAFFLTAGFLGMMYYFVPRQAQQPLWSYRFSIVNFWALISVYMWAGSHHLLYSALPDWVQSVGMAFSLVLLMPSWGSAANGLLTFNGSWHRLRTDPAAKFMVLALVFYAASTLEGSMMAVKTVKSLSHYTDWTIAHVHAGALGWVGFMSFGMIYWLMPRLFQTPLFSKKLMELHFWVATIGILLYIVAIYAAGLTQGLMWRAFDETGRLAYPDFVETTLRLIPMYWVRVVGGTLYLTGTALCGVNLLMTWRRRPSVYDEPVFEAPALNPGYVEPAPEATELERKKAPVTATGLAIDRFVKAAWHRRWEGLPLTFTVWVVIACVVASLFEIIPMFLIRSNVPTIATVKPYTPLELAGRDVYIAEGCNNCHSQMIRPIRSETVRYGEYSKPGEFVYDHPFLWGSRRIGPDLQRIGGKYPSLWHVRHFENPRSVTPQSIMPSYAFLLHTPLDFDSIPRHVAAQRMVGVPYSDADIKNAGLAAKTQAAVVAKDIADQGGPRTLEGQQVVALIAYLQRMGRDVQALPPAPTPAPAAAK